MTKKLGTLAVMFGVIMVLLASSAVSVSAESSISGLWKEVSTPDHANSYIIFSQDGATVNVTCYWEYKGTPIVWQGKGTRSGNIIMYSIKHTLYYPGWAVEGRHELILSPDGRTMNGNWYDTNGNSGPLTFTRVK